MIVLVGRDVVILLDTKSVHVAVTFELSIEGLETLSHFRQWAQAEATSQP